eukprot:3163350-Rhodomonas_salina.2
MSGAEIARFRAPGVQFARQSVRDASCPEDGTAHHVRSPASCVLSYAFAMRSPVLERSMRLQDLRDGTMLSYYTSYADSHMPRCNLTGARACVVLFFFFSASWQ